LVSIPNNDTTYTLSQAINGQYLLLQQDTVADKNMVFSLGDIQAGWFVFIKNVSLTINNDYDLLQSASPVNLVIDTLHCRNANMNGAFCVLYFDGTLLRLY
jgi:hypothetical protein